jgi:hypothetical protein
VTINVTCCTCHAIFNSGLTDLPLSPFIAICPCGQPNTVDPQEKPFHPTHIVGMAIEDIPKGSFIETNAGRARQCLAGRR